jgi:hypothetical protein
VIAYLVERARPQVVLPLAASIAGLAHLAGRRGDFRLDTLIALLLIAQFRLWDDLADIDRDRVAHPDRVLSRTTALERYVATCALLACANLVLARWCVSTTSAGLLLLLNAAVAAWYVMRPAHRSVFGDLFLLLKYPIFVVILQAGWPLTPLEAFAALSIYAAACVFEVWHDVSSPLRRWAHS